MAWNAVKEEEYRQARQAAGWRWVAYFLTLVGLVTIPAGGYILDRFGSDATPGDVWGVFGFIAAMILLLAILIDLPAEKAAKKAKLLRAEKQASVDLQ